jgi:hypothetical protein
VIQYKALVLLTIVVDIRVELNKLL